MRECPRPGYLPGPRSSGHSLSQPWLPCGQLFSLTGQAVSLHPHHLIGYHLVVCMGWAGRARGSTFREGFVAPWKNWK